MRGCWGVEAWERVGGEMGGGSVGRCMIGIEDLAWERIRCREWKRVVKVGQFTYHFNYWGPVGVNRDTHVLVRKMEKVEY